MRIEAIDHLVLTVRSISATCAFNSRVLGMEVVSFGEGRTARAFGQQRLNLRQLGREFEPKAASPTPGAIDICPPTTTPLSTVVEHLYTAGVAIIEGPIARTGATGPITSVSFRDPDDNLIEVSNPAQP